MIDFIRPPVTPNKLIMPLDIAQDVLVGRASFVEPQHTAFEVNVKRVTSWSFRSADTRKMQFLTCDFRKNYTIHGHRSHPERSTRPIRISIMRRHSFYGSVYLYV